MFEKIYCTFLLSTLLIVALCDKESDTNKTLCKKCDCKYEDGVITVDCANKNLGEISNNWTIYSENRNLTSFTHTTITFNKNNIEKLQVLPQLTNKTLDLSFVKCNMSEIEDGAFKNVKTMKFLDLGYNKLTGLKGKIFQAYPDESPDIDLEILNLGSNLIHSLERKMFKNTPNLKTLYLNDNPIDTIDSVTILAISRVVKLEVLDISRTGIKKLPDELFKQLKNMKKLYASGNKFKTVPESLGELGGTLTFLALNENPIQEIVDNSFLGLGRLETLQISGMETLKDVKSNAFIQLKSLKQLHMCENSALEHIGHDAFDGLKKNWQLKEIYLNDNKMRHLPKDLLLWKELDKVNLENNPWICDCEMAFDLKSGLSEKLEKNSHAKCVEPPEMSGRELIQLKLEDVCSSDRINSTTVKVNAHANQHSAYKNIRNILISVTVLVILLVVGVIIGVRTTQWRVKLRNITISPIHYTNVSTI
ncbi:uncharacterized protein LOC143916928 [Arctopsyche grandis]|uniref:uncharacterized protein LOC143916928 n=1 Tax=Arctopsyche grandis TaxID=121162 RepID=UPI00406D82E9